MSQWPKGMRFVRRFDGFNRKGLALTGCGAEYDCVKYIMQCEKSCRGTGVFRRFVRLDMEVRRVD